MNVADRAIIGLLDIIAIHIDNGDFDKARGVINRTKTTLDGEWVKMKIMKYSEMNEEEE